MKSHTGARISINEGWKFMRYNVEPDKLIYDLRPKVTNRNDNVVADSKPTESVLVESSDKVLKNGFYHLEMILLKTLQSIISARR